MDQSDKTARQLYEAIKANPTRPRFGFGRKPAVVNIDLQKSYTCVGEFPTAYETDPRQVEYVNRIAELARGKRLPVVWTHVAYMDSGEDCGVWGTRTDTPDSLQNIKVGSRRAEFDDRLDIDRKRDVIINKRMASGFHETNLASVLSWHQVDTVIVTGGSTSGCVRATVVDSLSRGRARHPSRRAARRPAASPAVRPGRTRHRRRHPGRDRGFGASRDSRRARRSPRRISARARRAAARRTFMIAAVVLAAGASSRLGRPKALVPFEGRPLIRVAVTAATDGGCRPVLVVLGSDAETIRQSVGDSAVQYVINEDWREGMASSIRAGIRALGAPAPDGVLLLACDQPHLTPDIVRELCGRFGQGGVSAVACAYAGTIGIPALFGRSRFDELLELRGDRGARSVLERNPECLATLDWPSGAFDVDRPQDTP